MLLSAQLLERISHSSFLGKSTHLAFPVPSNRNPGRVPVLGNETGTQVVFPFLGTKRERDTPTSELEFKTE
jgi:hypothetical protein